MGRVGGRRAPKNDLHRQPPRAGTIKVSGEQSGGSSAAATSRTHGKKYEPSNTGGPNLQEECFSIKVGRPARDAGFAHRFHATSDTAEHKAGTPRGNTVVIFRALPWTALQKEV